MKDADRMIIRALRDRGHAVSSVGTALAGALPRVTDVRVVRERELHCALPSAERPQTTASTAKVSHSSTTRCRACRASAGLAVVRP